MKLKKDSKKWYKVRHISAFLDSKAAFDNTVRREMRKPSENRQSLGDCKKLQKML